MKKLTHKERTAYLYGLNARTWLWKFMPYTMVLKQKIKLAEDRIRELNKIHYMKRNFANITDCLYAIRFNREMIEETK